jgi:hypothetical protein
MSRSKLLAIAAGALATWLQADVDGVRHVQDSPADQLVSCVARTLGRPVYAEPEIGRLAPADGRCDVSVDGLAAWLKGQQILLAAAPPGQPGYLFPSRRIGPDNLIGDRIVWSKLSIVTRPEHLGNREGAHNVAETDLEPFAKQFLRAARPAPMYAPFKPDAGTDTATLEYRVGLMQRRMKPDGPETVIALLGSQGDPHRLAYGELVDGTLHVRWDSPVFSGWQLQIGFNDVTGDGEDEIVIGYAVGANATAAALIVFDRSGTELTRQTNCQDSLIWNPRGEVCPIVGTDMKLVPSKDGHAKDILVYEPGAKTGTRVRYRLKDGRYQRPAD